MKSKRIAIWCLASAVAVATGCMSSAKSRPPPDPAPEEALVEAPAALAVVTARALNVRGGPGRSHPVTGKLAKGDRVRVLEEQGDWRRVQLADGGSEGWVSSAHLAAE